MATNSLLSSELMMGIISALHPVTVLVCPLMVNADRVKSFESQRWQQFLVYIGFTLGALAITTSLS